MAGDFSESAGKRSGDGAQIGSNEDEAASRPIPSAGGAGIPVPAKAHRNLFQFKAPGDLIRLIPNA